MLALIFTSTDKEYAIRKRLKKCTKMRWDRLCEFSFDANLPVELKRLFRHFRCLLSNWSVPFDFSFRTMIIRLLSNRRKNFSRVKSKTKQNKINELDMRMNWDKKKLSLVPFYCHNFKRCKTSLHLYEFDWNFYVSFAWRNCLISFTFWCNLFCVFFCLFRNMHFFYGGPMKGPTDNKTCQHW